MTKKTVLNITLRKQNKINTAIIWFSSTAFKTLNTASNDQNVQKATTGSKLIFCLVPVSVLKQVIIKPNYYLSRPQEYDLFSTDRKI
jgi:hypothetical protein